MTSALSVLVIEDSEIKWQDISALLNAGAKPQFDLERAATMEQATKALESKKYDLVLLDISLDIRQSEAGPKAGGHDTIGGLRVAERMYYLGNERPTIIVTAFDAFPSRGDRGNVVVGIDDVIKQANGMLGDKLRGWVRYGAPNWKADLVNLVLGEFRR